MIKVESKVLDLANNYLNQIEPNLIEGGDPKEITNPELVAVCLAVEQGIANLVQIMEANLAQVNTALMTATKLGLKVT